MCSRSRLLAARLLLALGCLCDGQEMRWGALVAMRGCGLPLVANWLRTKRVLGPSARDCFFGNRLRRGAARPEQSRTRGREDS